MADDVQLSAAVGTGDVVAADEISSVKYQRIKLVHGADGVNAGDVATGNPFPVRLYIGTTIASVGAGVVDTGTLRTTSASDDPSVVALQIIDDWDESDRAKVNPIVGQAGVAAGAGAVGTTVQRMTLASDDPAVAVLGAVADAAATQGSTGSISAKLRTITSQLNSFFSTGVSVTNIQQSVTVAGVHPADVAITGSPVLAGGYASAAAPADVSADGDAAYLWSLRNGALCVNLTAAGALIPGSATDGLLVNLGSNNDVTVTGDALTALQLIDDTVFAEDAGHSTGNKGIMGLAVRNDSDASLCDTTLDYTPLQVDANGYLKVNIKAGAGSGGTASTDDAAFTAAAGSGTPMMGFVTADSVDSGDVGVVGMLANRQLKVTLYDSGGTELSVGGGTQYTEDAAAAANPVGNALIVVREDGRAGSLTTADGDNVALRGNNFGELYVKHTDTIAATQSGTWNITNVSGTVSLPTGASTAAKQPALGTAGTASSDVITIQGIAAMTPVLVTLSGTNNIATVTTVTTVSTVTNVATIGTSVTPGTSAAHLGKAEDAAHSSGDTGVFMLAVRSDTAAATGQTDGDYTALVTDSTGRLWCNVSNTLTVASHAVTNAGTFVVQVDGTALTHLSNTATSLAVIDDWDNAASDGASVSGDVAHDAADAGEPVKIGAKAETSPKGITAVSDGDRTDLLADADGMLMVKLLTSGADFMSEAVSNTDGASTALTTFAAVANLKNCITAYSIFRTDSGTSLAYVDFRDGAAGAVLWRVPLPAGGGANLSLGGLPIFKTSANTALAIDVSSALSTVYISVSGYQSKV